MDMCVAIPTYNNALHGLHRPDLLRNLARLLTSALWLTSEPNSTKSTMSICIPDKNVAWFTGVLC